MYAPLTVLEPQLPPRRVLTEDTEIETLLFVDLNSEETVEQSPPRELPEELTGTYYTG